MVLLVKKNVAPDPADAGRLGGVAVVLPDCSSLIYSTYLGGEGQDEAHSIAVDASGNAYVTGETSSDDFPITNAFQPTSGGTSDAFVLKLSPTGELRYSTYLGGVNLEAGQGIAVDTSGSAYVTGFTSSLNFPTQNPLQGPHFSLNGASSDVFITKLSPDGLSLVYSTYLGGSNFENLDEGAIAVAANGEVVVTGKTRSDDIDTVNAAQPTYGGGEDSFAARLNATATALVYWTYLGGSGVDSGSGVAIGDDGAAYIVGETRSEDFPVLNAYQPTFGGGLRDGFLVRLYANGELASSTYLGGEQADDAEAVAVNSMNEVYVTGSTFSDSFPVVHPVFPRPTLFGNKVFVTRFAHDRSTILTSNILAGGSGLGVVVQGERVAVAGLTNDPNFPTRQPYQDSLRGRQDAFVTILSESQAAFVYLPLTLR